MSGVARYQYAYRQRMKAGKCVLRVTIDAVRWTEALIASGMLQPADYNIKPAIEARDRAADRGIGSTG
jgi:hypothetical protein